MFINPEGCQTLIPLPTHLFFRGRLQPGAQFMSDSIMITTTSEIAGKRIVKTLGLVRGNTIRSRHLGHDILASLKNLVGGEISDYTKMIAECREESLDRMVAEARANGANAVIGVRFATSEMMDHAAELLAYGTAVIVEDI
jgi:uncharacterized protein YbjQ (UPF0145 family)